MERTPPLILAATVSNNERLELEKALKEAGFEVRGILDAKDAVHEIAAHRGTCVLVMDGSLLLIPNDGQWRRLRERNPSVGAVIRSLISKKHDIQHRDGTTILVHPDRPEMVVRAVRSLLT